ncbi:MAG TPA: urea ABC transporter ATP-binding subunit UrtE [Planctomycetota bacterium]|nr:urea ABC transporter ATP-binding subunit UrtE [Planctomycetota bacterium]
MLAIDGLHYAYGAVAALNGVSLSADPGVITCVMGRNGVGKTTLMRTVMGSYRATRGTVTLDGIDVTRLPAHARARAGLALVPQGREIFPKLTVADNLRIGLEARRDGRRTIPDDVFELFPVLRLFLKRMGGDLSGGQQQQLAIARALVGEPSVLLLDEPTEGIQPNVIHDIGVVLRRLAGERRMTIVLVEQYLDFVAEFGHRFAIMDRGQVAAAGDTSALTPALVDQHLRV